MGTVILPLTSMGSEVHPLESGKSQVQPTVHTPNHLTTPAASGTLNLNLREGQRGAGAVGRWEQFYLEVCLHDLLVVWAGEGADDLWGQMTFVLIVQFLSQP